MTTKNKSKKKKKKMDLTCYVDINEELTCYMSDIDKNEGTVTWTCSICNHTWKDKVPRGNSPPAHRKCKKCSEKKLKSLKSL